MSNMNQYSVSAENQPIPLNKDLAQFLAQSMHNLIKRTYNDDVILEINNNITSYLTEELSKYEVQLPNKEDSFLYLSKKFEIITAVLEIIKNARSLYPLSAITLYYDDGKDEEAEEDSLPSLILYVKNDSTSKEIRQQIRALSDPYEELFARYNAFFHTEPYLVNYV